MANLSKQRASKRTAKTPKSRKTSRPRNLQRHPKQATAQVKSNTVYKRLTGQNGKPFEILKARSRFKKSLTLKKATLKSSLEKQFQKKIAPEFRKQFKKHGKKGQYKILRVSINHNVRGKRLKNGFSGYRTKIKSKKELETALGDLYAEMLKAFDRYLNRKDYQSLTIKGVSMEVSKKDGNEENATQVKPAKTRFKKKKSK